jgi:hypothetical protein
MLEKNRGWYWGESHLRVYEVESYYTVVRPYQDKVFVSKKYVPKIHSHPPYMQTTVLILGINDFLLGSLNPKFRFHSGLVLLIDNLKYNISYEYNTIQCSVIKIMCQIRAVHHDLCFASPLSTFLHLVLFLLSLDISTIRYPNIFLSSIQL